MVAALRDNKVIFIYSLSSSYANFYLYSQTLTTLYLHWNKIAAVGAQYLANALRDNKVILN